MQATKHKNEVKFSLPKPVMDRFRIAAAVARKPVDVFIKEYAVKCMEVDISRTPHSAKQPA